MKKMRIEKSLLFQDPVEKVLTLKVTEGFTYKQEDDGIRATGPLFIRGIYENEEQHKFQEILEMDVLAPKEKLSGENFFLEVGDFQGIPSAEGIDVTIMIHIHGLIEDMEASAQSSEAAETIPLPDSLPEPLDIAGKKELEENDKIEQDAPEAIANEDQTVIEDLFEDANNVYTSYRIIVAKPNDTYETIANRYQVEESDLRSTNANKAVEAKTLVILPYEHQRKKE